jgi:hypothetical protein
VTLCLEQHISPELYQQIAKIKIERFLGDFDKCETMQSVAVLLVIIPVEIRLKAAVMLFDKVVIKFKDLEISHINNVWFDNAIKPSLA